MNEKYFILFTGFYFIEMSYIHNSFNGNTNTNLYTTDETTALNIIANNDFCFLYKNDLSETTKQFLIDNYKFIEFRFQTEGQENYDAINIVTEEINIYTTEYTKISTIFNSITEFLKGVIQPVRNALVSPGGVASTAFLQFLGGQSININKWGWSPNGDGIKHCQPDSSMFKVYNPQNIVYLYGDLAEMVRSFFNRGILSISYFYNTPNCYLNPAEHERVRTPMFATFMDYIDHVLNTGTEPFGIVRHWNAWKNYPNVYFLKYTDIPTDTNIDYIFGLPAGTCANFTVNPDQRAERLAIETDEYINIMNNIEATQRI